MKKKKWTHAELDTMYRLGFEPYKQGWRHTLLRELGEFPLDPRFLQSQIVAHFGLLLQKYIIESLMKREDPPYDS